MLIKFDKPIEHPYKPRARCPNGHLYDAATPFGSRGFRVCQICKERRRQRKAIAVFYQVVVEFPDLEDLPDCGPFIRAIEAPSAMEAAARMVGDVRRAWQGASDLPDGWADRFTLHVQRQRFATIHDGL